jgi:hypothetical protein
LDVFWAGVDGAIWTNWWDSKANNGQWNTAVRITGPNVAPPGAGVAAIARNSNHLDVFWADNGGAIGTNWWDGSDPKGFWDQHPAFRISDPNVAPPGAEVAVVSRNPNHLDVFWADNGGAIGTNWWDASDPKGFWDQHPAFRISAAKTVPPGAVVAAVARHPDHLDVFWADNQGQIGTNWWDANVNNGQWSTPFRISNANILPAGAGVTAVARFQDHLDVFWADDLKEIGTTFWPNVVPGLANYWRDMSYEQFTLDGTGVFGWFTMSESLAQLKQFSRQQKIDACVSAAAANGIDVSQYFTVVGIVNALCDSGSANGKTILDPGAWILDWAAHETGHDLGLDHSFDDNPTSCSPGNDSRPGAYGDGWDIMSFACFGGINPTFQNSFTLGSSGPGLNAPYRDKLGWIPSNRVNSLVAGSATHEIIKVAALNHPEADGYLMVKLFMNPTDQSQYYTLEFRRKEEWDAGIPRHAVLVHLVKNGLSYLIKADGGPERLPGVGFIDPTKNLLINIESIPVDATSISIDVTLN